MLGISRQAGRRIAKALDDYVFCVYPRKSRLETAATDPSADTKGQTPIFISERRRIDCRFTAEADALPACPPAAGGEIGCKSAVETAKGD